MREGENNNAKDVWKTQIRKHYFMRLFKNYAYNIYTNIHICIYEIMPQRDIDYCYCLLEFWLAPRTWKQEPMTEDTIHFV